MPLTIEAGGRSFAFILQISSPPETISQLMEFFINRRIVLESLQMQVYPIGTARLIIHCRIERDRIRHTLHQMEKIKGINELEWMESRGSGSRF